MNTDLFVYGTLLEPRLILAVCGYVGRGAPATLTGFRRQRVLNAAYPAIVEDARASVEGVVYQALSRQQLHRLDEYEGEMYARCPVAVTGLRDGVVRQVYTYVLRPRFVNRLSDEPWSLDWFHLHHADYSIDD